MRSFLLLLAAPVLLAGCNAPSDQPVTPTASASASATPEPSSPPTQMVPPVDQSTPDEVHAAPNAPTIYDQAMAERLRTNKGLTLQWIDWNRRGTAQITVRPDGAWHLTGRQRSTTGDGLLMLDGVVTEVGRDYFVFDGKITITDTPDVGRQCSADKVWQFGITQRRSYWRLREFEWCDGLTDYIDIYF